MKIRNSIGQIDLKIFDIMGRRLFLLFGKGLFAIQYIRPVTSTIFYYDFDRKKGDLFRA